MKNLIVAALAVASLGAFAEETLIEKLTPTKEQWDKMTKEERKASMDYRLGGYVEKPGSRKGQIVYVNAQKRVADAVIKANIDELQKKTKFDIVLKSGEFSFPSPRIEGSVSLYIVDDPAMPPILSAPESRWAMVNVAGLSAGNGAQPTFFEARVKKELTRGFCILAGAQDSTYKGSLLGPITKPEDLDDHIDCRFPVDIQQRFRPYLEKLGVTPIVIVPYKRACQEGWAPAPTNDVQKAHWDEAHTIPKKPIKIKYNPKTGK